jgi:hypothetical protein
VLDNATAPASIAQMLRDPRAVPHLRELWLIGTRLDGDALRRICDCVPVRPKLTSFRFAGSANEAVIRPDTLAGALGPASSLVALEVCATWTHEGLVAAVRLLRTNETLRHLEMLRLGEEGGGGGGDNNPSELVLAEFYDLLWHHNFTLRRVTLFCWRERASDAPIRAALKQNSPIQRDDERWKERGGGYHLEPATVWPVVMGRMSRIPTLLYRFLRRDNLQSLAAIVSVGHG